MVDRIDELERRLETVESGRASEESYGLARISESGAVTDTGSGLVLSAREKNSSEQGTIMNFVSELEESLGNIKFLSYARFNNSTETEFVLNVCQDIKVKESRHIYLFNGVWETHSEFLCIASRQEAETSGIILMHNKPVIFSSYGSGEPIISKILIEQY